MKNNRAILARLKQKATFVRRETLRIHGLLPETRIASSLSDIEIFVCLYYGGILNFNPQDTLWEQRDRFIVSKGHGGVSLYPILAELGFFDRDILETIGQKGSFLGSIPDCFVPGIETINGSLGHGLGVAAGIALGLKAKKNPAKVFVLLGDGELYEGSVWEAMMFASHNKLNNLIAILDNNKISMLDFCKNALDHEPLEKKFESFGWGVQVVNGHDLEQLFPLLQDLKTKELDKPHILIANTVKGKGVKQLEGDSLCHVKSLSKDEVIQILKKLP